MTHTAPAVAGGATVTLSSGTPVASVPGSVTVPAGATTATFVVTTTKVTSSTAARITARYGDATRTADLAIDPGPCSFSGAPEALPLFVYAGDQDPRNRFVPSGFFGDTTDLRISESDRSEPAPPGGGTSIRIDYTPKGSGGFAGIFWQCPPDNWGTEPDAGFNLSAARQIRFYARASLPGAKAEFKAGGVGRGSAPYPDSFDATSTVPQIVEIGTAWREFTISLTGKNLTRVIGGFMFVTNVQQNPSGVSVYLANIVWE